MAVTKLNHWLKYYKEIQSQGHTWRLEILQRARRPLVQVEIGSVLQGLRLYVQGDQSDIDTPIVKTSLEMTFVDAPDLEADRKCGNWEVFYTSSATEYKVKLYKDGVVEWTGYITPDSYSEDLMYRGSVTIIARDNLGALQDFEFDATGDEDGMITLYDLVHTGMERISFAMEVYDDHSAASVFPVCVDADSPILYKVKFNVSSFREKSWQEAIEDAMYSCGVVLRYIGNNQFFFCPLRAVPLMGQDMWCRVATKDVRFASYGHRELSPAVKAISEIVNFEIADNIIEIYSAANSYKGRGEMLCQESLEGYFNKPMKEISVPVYGYSANIGQGLMGAEAENSRLLNVYDFPIEHDYADAKYGAIKNTSCIYLLCNTLDLLKSSEGYYQQLKKENPLTASFRIQKEGTYAINYTFDYPVSLYGNKVGNVALKAPVGVSMMYVGFNAKWLGDDGSVQYLNVYSRPGATPEVQWTTSAPTRHMIEVYYNHNYVDLNEFPRIISLPNIDVAGAGRLTIECYGAHFDTYEDAVIGDGVYLRLTGIDVARTKTDNLPLIMDKLTVTTKYKEANNVILNRDPQYASNPSQAISPLLVQNGIFVTKGKQLIGSESWRFYENDTLQSLSVLIHQQLLAYYSKPNNILTGELVVDDADFRSLYLWKGKKHMLTAGALNILTGHIEGATLREFKRYSELWETDAETDYVEFRIGGGTQTIALTSNKELTSADVHIDDTWCSATIESTGTQAYSLTINAGYNSTGEARVAFITIDTFTIMVKQIAQLIID